jgi:hypothetical protein
MEVAMGHSSALPGTVISRHFEVVDGHDMTVGSVKHSTRAHAHDLREALTGTNGLGVLAVAEVTERLVIHREVRRVGDHGGHTNAGAARG